MGVLWQITEEPGPQIVNHAAFSYLLGITQSIYNVYAVISTFFILTLYLHT